MARRRATKGSPVGGAPPAGCPPFQARGKPAAGVWQERVREADTHICFFPLESCATDLPAERSGGGLPATGRPGGARCGGASLGLCPLPSAARSASFRCPYTATPTPRPSLRRRAEAQDAAPGWFVPPVKCTKWKFNRPVACVVEISGSCFGIFYDTFVYVGEA